MIEFFSIMRGSLILMIRLLIKISMFKKFKSILFPNFSILEFWFSMILKMLRKPPNSTMFNLSECKVLISFLIFDSKLTDILRKIFKFSSNFWKTVEFNSVLKFFNRANGGIGRKEK